MKLVEALFQLAVAGVVLFFVVKTWLESREVPEADKAPSVDAGELCSAYAANEVAADQRFKGNSLVVTGVVNGITSTSDGASVDLYCSGVDVTADFNDTERSFVATLKDGDPVAILCLGNGSGLGPRLRNCRKAP